MVIQPDLRLGFFTEINPLDGTGKRSGSAQERVMANGTSIGLFAGLLCTCSATAYAQDAIPNFSSIDSPWATISGDFLPPPSGLGPITYDKAHPVMRRNANARGDVVETPRLANVVTHTGSAALGNPRAVSCPR